MTRRFAIKTTFEGAIAHDVRYWLRATVEERIGAPTRMARVSRRIEAPWRPVPARGRTRPVQPPKARFYGYDLIDVRLAAHRTWNYWRRAIPGSQGTTASCEFLVVEVVDASPNEVLAAIRAGWWMTFGFNSNATA